MVEEPILPRWVDWHCHLDLYRDQPRVIRECDQSQTATLAVTTTPAAFERNVELAAASFHVRVALGLHPQLVSSRAQEIALFEKFLPRTRFVGEIGLDAGRRHYGSFAAQQSIFERVLKACDEQGDKILSIHSVRTVAKVLELLERNLRPKRCVPILHWFTGSRSEAARATALGCYFSINPEMLRSERSRAMVRALPSDRIFTETDGPFVEIAGREALPTDIPSVIDDLSAVLGVDPEALRTQVVVNLSTILEN